MYGMMFTTGDGQNHVFKYWRGNDKQNLERMAKLFNKAHNDGCDRRIVRLLPMFESSDRRYYTASNDLYYELR